MTTSTWKRSQASIGRVRGEHARFVNGHRPNRRNVVDGNLQCGDCRKWLPLEDFSDNANGGRINKAHYCKPCQNKRSYWSHVRLQYGVTKDQYEAMLLEQGGVCAICGTPPAPVLCIDHCHDSLAVRGLLCRRCNTALGVFKTPALLRSAGRYLAA
jgi:hypothetical protein